MSRNVISKPLSSGGKSGRVRVIRALRVIGQFFFQSPFQIVAMFDAIDFDISETIRKTVRLSYHVDEIEHRLSLVSCNSIRGKLKRKQLNAKATREVQQSNVSVSHFHFHHFAMGQMIVHEILPLPLQCLAHFTNGQRQQLESVALNRLSRLRILPPLDVRGVNSFRQFVEVEFHFLALTIAVSVPVPLNATIHATITNTGFVSQYGSDKIATSR